MSVFCEGMLIIEEVAKTEDAKDNTDEGNANLEEKVQNPEAKAEKEECEHGCRFYWFTVQRYELIFLPSNAIYVYEKILLFFLNKGIFLVTMFFILSRHIL